MLNDLKELMEICAEIAGVSTKNIDIKSYLAGDSIILVVGATMPDMNGDRFEAKAEVPFELICRPHSNIMESLHVKVTIEEEFSNEFKARA